jgi:hypothetical protein
MTDNNLIFVQFNDLYLLANTIDKPIEKEDYKPIIKTALYTETTVLTNHSNLSNNKKEYFVFFSISQISKLKQLGYTTEILSDSDKKNERSKIHGTITFKTTLTPLPKYIRLPYYDYAYLRLQEWLEKDIHRFGTYNEETCEIEKTDKTRNSYSLLFEAEKFLKNKYPNITIKTVFRKVVVKPDPERQKYMDEMLEYMLDPNPVFEPTAGNLLVAYIREKNNSKNNTELNASKTIPI